jgi:hypothetical protein
MIGKSLRRFPFCLARRLLEINKKRANCEAAGEHQVATDCGVYPRLTI